MALSFRRNIDQLQDEAIKLLSSLIKIPSFSKDEHQTADLLESFLKENGVVAHRAGNNVWATNEHYHPDLPTILLNSHHDTVKPNQGYSKDPFDPIIENDRLYGLGSNDAGASLVSLLMTFLYLYDQTGLKYNLLFAASAEEEVSGAGGVELLLKEIGPISFGIVGEPTEMEMAIAEKGLMVLDCYAKGKSGHAAREEGVNAIYEAMKDIEWFRSFTFPKVSEYLGPVRMSVTMIDAGQQHNVVPDVCHFVVDIRGTDVYSNEEILSIIRNHVTSEVKERSTRLQPSFIDDSHPLVQMAKALGIRVFGSPTMSDQALMEFPTVKIGPGQSARSHSSDEYVRLEEIQEGIYGYLAILNKLLKS